MSTIIFGLHAALALLTKQPQRVARLCVLKERDDHKLQEIISLANSRRVPVEHRSRVELDRLVKGENHQGVVVFAHAMKNYNEHDLDALLDVTAKPLLLVLDGIQDPHNLGACLRSADAAGVTAVIAPRDKAVGITPVVSKVACGAAETVPFIQVTNLARTLRDLKERGIWIFGAAGEANQTVYRTDLTVATAFVLGAEGAGLRRLTREHCDVLIKIPMQGSVSSLNVSVATGILLFEAIRQRE